MALRATGRRPSGYDDGARPTKRQRIERTGPQAGNQQRAEVKRQPRERFSDFASRVDQSLPITNLSRKGKKMPEIKERATRLQKKITRMQDAWRLEEARRKEKREEALDEAELENAINGAQEPASVTSRKNKKKRNGGSANDDEDDDPWAKLKASRGQRNALTDVAKAPPNFKRVPKASLKMRNNATVNVGSVPNTSGSLRRREELNSARQDVIANYRKMMEDKRST